MSEITRRVVLAGNWKMNLVRAEAAAFARALSRIYAEAADPGVDVVLFPSSPFLVPLSDLLRGTPVAVGGQDLHTMPSGAHTGDVSAAQLRSAGASWVLCGHSERRADHNEADALVGAKASAALDGGLAPMVCVGETESERDQGATESVLARQLDAALAACPRLLERDTSWALAYEPVWAIGTGKTATPQIAQEAHAFLRAHLEAAGAAAEQLQLLYGGSAKPANCAELTAEEDIDGLLIGGASLEFASFLDMIRRCGSATASSVDA